MENETSPKKEVNIEKMTELLDRVFLFWHEVNKAIEKEPNIENFPPISARIFLKQKGIYRKIWHEKNYEKARFLYKLVEQYTYNKLRSIEKGL